MERIQVIKTPQNAGLFDYSHMPEDNDKLENEQTIENEDASEESNDVVNDLLNALNEDEEDKEQA